MPTSDAATQSRTLAIPPHLKLTQKATTVRRNRWISGLLLTGVATAPPAVSFAADPPPISNSDHGSDISGLQSILLNSTAGPGSREEAARRLISRDAPEAHAQVIAVLKNGPATARLALLNAVAAASDPAPDLIPAMATLLDDKGELTGAVAAALLRYPEHPEAVSLLTKFASDPSKPVPQRTAVIGAMGSLVSQSIARYLIGRLQDPREPEAIRQAADQSLGTMTGLDFGTNTDAWLQWWTSNAGSWSSDHFDAQALKNRERKQARAQSRLIRLTDEAKRLLERNYLDIRDKQPADADATLLSYLNSTSPEIRSLGASQDFGGRPPSEKIKTRLREMIGDSDDAVRRQAVDVVLTINDHGAVEPLLEQLNVERDPAIKIQIVQALGKIEDKAVVPALMRLVHGQQLNLATLAALQIAGPLGDKLRKEDPIMADGISADLRMLVDAIANSSSDNDLRAACIKALAALRDPRSQATFTKFLAPGETVAVQSAAIEGLGNLGDTKTATIVSHELDDTQDRSIRLAAAHALLHIGTAEDVPTLSAKIKSETDPEVREAIWQAFKGLLDKLGIKDLELWANQFSDDPPKRLDILNALADRLARDHNDDELASTNQDIADTYMKINQPERAVASLQKSINYWKKGPETEVHLDAAIGQMMQYEIIAGKYSDAVAFAAAQVHEHRAYEQAVIPQLRDQANLLLNKLNASSKDLDNAKSIVTETLKIEGVSERYKNQLDDLLQSIQQKIDAQAAPH